MTDAEHPGTVAASGPTWIGAEELVRRVPPDRARTLLHEALAAGIDLTRDPPRTVATAGSGQLLLMPSSSDTAVGTKIIGLAADNPARGLPRIQAVYVLMDAETMTPSTLLDGIALTNLRTPATSAVAIDLLAPEEVQSAVVVGSGPQALGHVEALLHIRDVHRITVVGRDVGRAHECASRIAAVADGLTRASPDVVATTDRESLADAVRASQVVMCTTSSTTPVIDGEWVAEGACVVAVGTHESDHRELDAALMGRAQVVVEDVATALREAGDVVLAVAEGALVERDLHTLQELVRREVRRAHDRPNVFKSVGMAWQDLVVAEGAASPR